MKRVLYGLAALLALCGAAAAQVNYPSEQKNARVPAQVADCLNRMGIAVPCAFSDTRPEVAGRLRPATPDQRAQVVTISPNSTQGYNSPVTITRPANASAYTANDVVGQTAGASLTFGGIAPSIGGEIIITSAELEIDVAAVPAGMTSFRLYVYSTPPPSAFADNAAWDLPSGDRASYLGYVDLGTPVDLGSTLYVRTDAINAQFTAASSSLFGYLVTNGGYTPAGNSEVYKVTLHAVAP